MRKYTPNPIQDTGCVPLVVCSPCFLFCLSFKTLSRGSPSLHPLLFSSPFLSSLSSVLSFQISTSLSSFLAVKTCRGQLWRNKGKDMDGFPGSTTSQPGRQRDRQAASVFLRKATSHLFPCLPALNKEHREVYNTGRQCC